MNAKQNGEVIGMVGLVARAILAELSDRSGVLDGIDQDTVDEIGVACAVAAIEEMREPTDAMVWSHEVPHYGPDESREAWLAMIDAALSEKRP